MGVDLDMRAYVRPRIVISITLLLSAPMIVAGAAGKEQSGKPRAKHLERSFDLPDVRNVQVASHDGIVLNGWISFPHLPEGARAPVILQSTPYLGNCEIHPLIQGCYRTPADEGFWDDSSLQFDTRMLGIGIHPKRWIQRGYILAHFSVRGTGSSGGCFEVGGENEQRDQQVLVDWLAAQPWSNGRVGMGGLSYPGGVTWQAATQAPDALKAIVALSPVGPDLYTQYYTPQGARITPTFFIYSTLFPQLGLLPSVYGGGPDPAILVERALCPVVGEYGTQPLAEFARSRSASYYAERDLTPRLPGVRAAVLAVQGYRDAVGFFSDRELTSMLAPDVPRREIRGWWQHAYPDEDGPFTGPGADEASWTHVVTRWFDYWLKGAGTMPRVNVVDSRDQYGRWHSSAAWPPAEAWEGSLYLGTGLSRNPATEPRAFLAAPLVQETGFFTAVSPTGGAAAGMSLCSPALSNALAYIAAPQQAPVTLSGNPSLDVRIRSSLPGGVISATLFDLAPEFSCDAGVPSGVTWLATGAADLQHYRSRYEPVPFPIDRAEDIRVEISDLTATIEPGHRLALVLSGGEVAERLAGPGDYPLITVEPDPSGAMNLVTLPVVGVTGLWTGTDVV